MSAETLFNKTNTYGAWSLIISGIATTALLISVYVYYKNQRQAAQSSGEGSTLPLANLSEAQMLITLGIILLLKWGSVILFMNMEEVKFAYGVQFIPGLTNFALLVVFIIVLMVSILIAKKK